VASAQSADELAIQVADDLTVQSSYGGALVEPQ
jgi:hypothetical protein